MCGNKIHDWDVNGLINVPFLFQLHPGRDIESLLNEVSESFSMSDNLASANTLPELSYAAPLSSTFFADVTRCEPVDEEAEDVDLGEVGQDPSHVELTDHDVDDLFAEDKQFFGQAR